MGILSVIESGGRSLWGGDRERERDEGGPVPSAEAEGIAEMSGPATA